VNKLGEYTLFNLSEVFPDRSRSNPDYLTDIFERCLPWFVIIPQLNPASSTSFCEM